MTINTGALNTADFNTVTYYLSRLLIPRNKNPLYGIIICGDDHQIHHLAMYVPVQGDFKFAVEYDRNMQA